MASNNKLKRIRLIDQILFERDVILYRELIEILQDNLGENLHQKTIQKDVKFMRDEFGATIATTKGRNASIKYSEAYYSIFRQKGKKDQDVLLQDIQMLMQNFPELPMTKSLIEILSISNKKKIFLLDRAENGNIEMLQNIQSIFRAIQEKKVIRFYYRSNNLGSKPSIKTMSPFYLKEFNGIWYVIGIDTNKNKKVRFYGLDRVKDIGTSQFQKYDSWETKHNAYLNDIIGVNYDRNTNSQEVIFNITKTRRPFIEAKPLHKSQKLIQKNEDESALYSINVMKNKELMNKIYELGKDIEIISPESIRKSLRRTYSKLLKIYQ